MSKRSSPDFRAGIRLAAWCAVAATLLAPLTSTEAGELRDALAPLVEDVSRLLKGKGQQTIAIGPFESPSAASSGPAIVKVLKEEFEKRSIPVSASASIELRGEFELVDVVRDRQNFCALAIRGSLVDPSGATLTQFEFDEIVDGAFQTTLKEEATMIELLGPTVALPIGETTSELDRNRAIRNAVEKPLASVREGAVSANGRSPYSAEIWVGGRLRPAKLDESGQAFVSLQRGEVYEIVLRNRSELDAGVRVAVDGLSVFEFSDMRRTGGADAGAPLYSHFVIPAGGSAAIKGWHRDNSTVDSFQVNEYAKSAAAISGRQADVGTIVAAFSAAWEPGTVPPESQRKGAVNATGFGPPKAASSRPVTREIGEIRAAVSIRYDRGSE